MHEVRVLCACSNIECCTMERYVSDVRILQAEKWAVQMSQYVAAGAIGAIIAIGFAVGAFILWITVRREVR